MGLRSTRAVVSRTMRMSNSSKLVSLITEHYGLVKVVGKGARRPRSVFGASLEPVTLIECIYYHRDIREIQTLSSAETIKPFSALKENLMLFAVASCMVEIAQTHTAEEDVSAGTFDLVVDSLDSLESSVGKGADKHLWRYMLRLLTAVGYQLALDSCVNCGKKLKGASVFFSYADGGVLCSCTEPDNRYGFRVSAGSLMVMNSLLRATDAELPRLIIGKSQRAEVEQTLLNFLAYHSGSSKTPRSLTFLRRIEKDKNVPQRY